MTKLDMSEAPAAPTPRLVFDENISEDDIPLFLRKNKPVTDPDMSGLREPNPVAEISIDNPVDTSAEIIEPVSATMVESPAEQIPEPVENTESLEAPAQETTSDVVETKEDDISVTNDNGDPANLDEMSVEELKRHQEEIDRKIQEKREAQKKAVIAQIVEVVNTYNVPLDELGEALGGWKVKRKGVKATQKYQDPKTGATWSGRGKEPVWIRGKDRNKFLIK